MSKIVELKDEEAKQVSGGATAIQYGLIAAGVSLAIPKLAASPPVKSVGGPAGSPLQNR